MARALFIGAPHKERMILRMMKSFSPRMICKLVTSTYPATSYLAKRNSLQDEMVSRVFGDRDLWKAIVDFEPDVIYSDGPLYGTQFKLRSYVAGIRKPLILHLRGDWWREHRSWFPSPSWRQRAISGQQYTYNWAAVLLAAKLAPICKWLEKIVKHYVPHKRTEVVYQGVDPDEFYPESGMRLLKPAVAIIQNHTIFPKVLGLLKFQSVVRRLPNVQFYVAEGENVDQKFLPLVRAQYSGFANVHFLSGITGSSSVRKMLAAADCYVLSSELDCCPTTVLEASLVGKPVIASRIGGVPEIVLEDETGWAISNDLTDEWVQKISLAVTDARLNRRFGEKGRLWVSERFGWKTIAKQVEDLLISEIT